MILIEKQLIACNGKGNISLLYNNAIMSFIYGYFKGLGKVAVLLKSQERIKEIEQCFIKHSLRLPVKNSKYSKVISKQYITKCVKDIIWVNYDENIKKLNSKHDDLFDTLAQAVIYYNKYIKN